MTKPCSRAFKQSLVKTHGKEPVSAMQLSRETGSAAAELVAMAEEARSLPLIGTDGPKEGRWLVEHKAPVLTDAAQMTGEPLAISSASGCYSLTSNAGEWQGKNRVAHPPLRPSAFVSWSASSPGRRRRGQGGRAAGPQKQGRGAAGHGAGAHPARIRLGENFSRGTGCAPGWPRSLSNRDAPDRSGSAALQRLSLCSAAGNPIARTAPEPLRSSAARAAPEASGARCWEQIKK